jgi:hypothetical protein
MQAQNVLSTAKINAQTTVERAKQEAELIVTNAIANA